MAGIEPRGARLLPRQWPVIAIAALSLIGALSALSAGRRAGIGRSARADLAGLAQGVDDVQLIANDGSAVTWGEMNGKPRLVFFGFTPLPGNLPDYGG
ncbi:MAG: hypothetical protein R3C16_12465 [Hyphomonadaceae bacterium]